MKDNQKSQHEWVKSLFKGCALFACTASLILAGQVQAAPRAVSQGEFLRWMAQLTGDAGSFNANSTSADYVQWARSKGMNPSGGWQADAAISADTLAQSLVQLYNLNPRRYGGDSIRILEREGIIIDRSATVTRGVLSSLVDEFGFQNRTAMIARSSKTRKCDDDDDGAPGGGGGGKSKSKSKSQPPSGGGTTVHCKVKNGKVKGGGRPGHGPRPRDNDDD
jgi:hypothetical protein